MAGRITAIVLVLLSMTGFAAGQHSRAPITNHEVIDMVKAGISERTILLEFRKKPTAFDTSPEGLIELKKSGVSEKIIDAMLLAPKARPRVKVKVVSAPAIKPPSPPISEPVKVPSGEEMIAKALDAFGPHGKLIAIHSIRWTASVSQDVAGSAQGGTVAFGEAGIRVFPGLTYIEVERPSVIQKVVVTPDFSYRSWGQMAIALPDKRVGIYREEMKFDPVRVAQHLSDYIFTPLRVEQQDGAAVDVVKISADGMDYVWRIDSQTGRLLSAKHQTPAGEMTVEYSDYRQVDGINLPFKKRTVTSDRSTDMNVTSYKINPDVDGSLFLRPASLSQAGLSLKVLQSESISYTQDLGGGNSANCQLSESASPSGVADSLDDVGLASGEPGSNFKMICNSSDENSIMPRILNAMLVVSSDGNAYAIACDKAWHFSKCAPLDVGAVVHGGRDGNKIDVHGVNAEGKEQNATYTILLAKPLQ